MEPSLLAPPAETLGEHSPPVLAATEARQALVYIFMFLFFALFFCNSHTGFVWVLAAWSWQIVPRGDFAFVTAASKTARCKPVKHCYIVMQGFKMPAIQMYHSISCNPTIITVKKNMSVLSNSPLLEGPPRQSPEPIVCLHLSLSSASSSLTPNTFMLFSTASSILPFSPLSPGPLPGISNLSILPPIYSLPLLFTCQKHLSLASDLINGTFTIPPLCCA